MPHGGILKGFTVVITGGTAGIGRACAEALLAAGASGLLINGRDPTRAKRSVSEIMSRFPTARVSAVTGDVAKPEVAEAVMTGAIAAFGRIDVLVNASGGTDIPKLLHEIDLEAIPPIVERCLFGQILCSRAALTHMRKAHRGVIINVASDAAKIPTAGESVIGAAMAGIVMFTRGLAIEAKRDGIRANVITPSITTGTDHYDRLMADSFAGKLFSKAAKQASLGVVDKRDLAELVVFLASPLAAKITGQAISVTGGISAL